jgi:hypothetical protein
MIAVAVPLAQLALPLAAAVTIATSALVARPVLPRNIQVPDNVRLTFERWLLLSPTLSKQCRIIGETRHVRVVIRFSSPMGTLTRARATITRYELGALLAEIDIPISRDLFELVAHELEHVIEQMEGVKLADLARSGAAYRDASGTFETHRAMLTGQLAAAEVRHHTTLLAATPRRR